MSGNFLQSYGVYLSVLFFFDIAPGMSFAIVAKNTMSQTLKIGLITALGVAISDGLSAILAMLGIGTMLSLNPKLMLHLEWLSIFALLYYSVKMIISDKTENAEDSIKTTQDKTKTPQMQALSDGFLYTFLNPAVIISIASILTQYNTITTTLPLKSLWTISVPIVSFFSFSLIAVVFNFKPLRPFIRKNEKYITKISGFCIFFLILSRASSILYR